MKTLRIAMLIGAIGLVGCTRESPKGGPGATTTTTRTDPAPTARTDTTDKTTTTTRTDPAPTTNRDVTDKTTTTTQLPADNNRDKTTTKTTTTTTNTDKRDSKRDDTFSVRVPAGATNVTQGKREEVTISINRDGDFNEPVHVKFNAPKGITVVPAETSIKSGETKATIAIEASADAPVGRHSITVTGSPQTGQSTSVKMDIDVKKKG